MTTTLVNKSRRKQILKDPMSAYVNDYPDPSLEKKAQMSALCDQYHSFKEQHSQLQDKTRNLSRQIGEAKKNNQPVEQLKELTKETSSQAKQLAKELKKIEEDILSLFTLNDNENLESGKTNDKSNVSSDEKIHTRQYSEPDNYSEKFAIALLGDDTQEWNQYVKANTAASIYHLAEWKTLIENTFGHQPYYYLARDTNSKVIGILPLIRLKSYLFGDYLVSLPYFNYGGAIANHPDIEKRLMATASETAHKLKVQHIEFRDDIERTDFPVKTDKVNMILELPDNNETLWNNFTPKLRAQIKRPQREKPEVFIGQQNLLKDFYNVFSRNMRDLGTPVYDKRFFKNILKTFPDNAYILIIKWNGRAVAAAFLIGHKDTLEIPWASSLRTVNHLSMNMLMYWEVLKFAIDSKYSYFDFGRSSKDSGTYRFKQQWGAKPKALFWHYWLPKNGMLPSLNPSNPKYALVINIWKKLPVFITRLIGPMLVKNLP